MPLFGCYVPFAESLFAESHFAEFHFAESMGQIFFGKVIEIRQSGQGSCLICKNRLLAIEWYKTCLGFVPFCHAILGAAYVHLAK